jgi:hypothetical protein
MAMQSLFRLCAPRAVADHALVSLVQHLRIA